MEDKLISARNFTREQKFFLFIANIYKAESQSTSSNFYVLNSLRFLIYYASIADLQKAVGLLDKLNQTVLLFLLILTHLFSVATLTYLTSFFIYFWRRPSSLEFDRAPRGKIQILNFILGLQTQVCSPLMLWISEICCHIQGWSTSIIMLVRTISILNLLLISLVYYFHQDSTPNGTPNSVLDVEKTTVAYFGKKIMMGLFIYVNYGQPTFIKVWLQVLAPLISLGLIVLNFLTITYWSAKSNRFSFCSHLILAALILFWLGDSFFLNSRTASVCLIVMILFTLWITVSRSQNFARQDFFNKKSNNQARSFAVMMMESSMNRETELAFSEDYIYYLGLLFERFRRFPNKKKANSLNPTNLKDRAEYIVACLSTELKDFNLFKICFYYLLMFPLDLFPHLRSCLTKLKAFATTGSIRRRLEVFHMALLLQTTLESHYYLKEQEKKNSYGLADVYRYISTQANREISENYVNLQYPLQCKRIFQQLSDLFANLVNQSREVFKYVIATRKQHQELSMANLFDAVTKVRDCSLTFEEYLKFSQEVIPKPPKYYFPLMYAYSSAIQFKPAKARNFMLIFKQGQTRWDEQNTKIRNISLKKEPFKPAVLMVSMAHQSVGLIIETTPMAESQLKLTKSGGSLIGKNINDMFISHLQQYHWELMNSPQSFSNQLNLLKRFFLKRFDMSFKEVHYEMKLIPSLEKDFLAMVSMTFLKKTRGYLLLLDKDQQVIEAEEEIWSLLKIKSKSKRKEINLSSLSEKLSLIVVILEELQNITDKINLLNFSDDSMLGSTMAIVKKIINLNKLEKVYVDTDRNSRHCKELEGTRIYLKIEPMNFKEIQMTKLYMTFQTRGRLGFETYTTMNGLIKSTVDLNAENNSSSTLEVTGSFHKEKGTRDQEVVPSASDLDNHIENSISYDTLFYELVSLLRNLNSGSPSGEGLTFKTSFPKLLGLLMKYWNGQKVYDNQPIEFEKFEYGFQHSGSIQRGSDFLLKAQDRSENDLKSDYNNEASLLGEKASLNRSSKVIDARTSTDELRKSEKNVQIDIRDEKRQKSSIFLQQSLQNLKTEEKIVKFPSFSTSTMEFQKKMGVKIEFIEIQEDESEQSKSNNPPPHNFVSKKAPKKLLKTKTKSHKKLSATKLKSDNTTEIRTGTLNGLEKNNLKVATSPTLAPPLKKSAILKPEKSENAGSKSGGSFSSVYYRADHIDIEKEKHQKANLIQLAKVKPKANRIWMLYMFGLLSFIAGVAASLMIVRQLINTHVDKANELFKAVIVFSENNYRISGSLMAFMQLMAQAFNTNRGVNGTKGADAFMAKVSYTSNYTNFLNSSLQDELVFLTNATNQAKQLLGNSVNLRAVNFSGPGFENVAKVYINETATLGSQANPFASLNIVQLMDLYRLILGKQVTVDIRKPNIFDANQANFLVNKGFDSVLSEVSNRIFNCSKILKDETTAHNLDLKNILTITSAIVGFVFVVWICLMYYHRVWLGDVFGSFAVLSNSALYDELARFEAAASALGSDKFESDMKMMQVREACASYMPPNFDKLQTSMTHFKDVKEVKTKDSNSKKKVLDNKEKRTTQLSKFVYGRPIRMFWWMFILNLLFLIFWGIDLIIVLQIDSIVKDSDLIREKAIENIHFAIRFRIEFAKMVRINPWTTTYMSARELNRAMQGMTFRFLKNDYLYWWTTYQGVIASMLEKNNTLEIFQTESMCTMENLFPASLNKSFASKVANDDCFKVLGGIANKGYFQYAVFEAFKLQDIQQSLLDTTALMVDRKLTSAQYLGRLQNTWFSEEFAQLRVWHTLLYSKILGLAFVFFTEDITNRTSVALKSVELLQMIAFFLFILPVMFFALVIIPQVKQAYLNSIATFNLISPFVVIGNQLLLKKFRACFRDFISSN